MTLQATGNVDAIPRVRSLRRRGVSRLNGGRGRVAGLDVARGVAVIGMVGANVLALSANVIWHSPASYTAVVQGRSSVLFAVLAGISLSIMAGGREPVVGLAGLQARTRIVVRAVLIFGIGGLLVWLHSPELIILEQYAVMFVFALPFLRWPARRLFILSAAIALVVPIFVHGGLGPYSDPVQGSYFGYLLVTGPYPALSWFAYTLAGLGVGRLAYRTRATQWKLLAAGACVSVLGYGGSALLVHTPLPWEYRESLPHSNTTFELLGAGGFAIAVFALCLLVTGPLRRLLVPIGALGSMPLTFYCVHVISTCVHSGQWTKADYVVCIVVFLAAATAWRFFIGRGPVEALVGAVSWRAATVPERACGAGRVDVPEVPVERAEPAAAVEVR